LLKSVFVSVDHICGVFDVDCIKLRKSSPWSLLV